MFPSGPAGRPLYFLSSVSLLEAAYLVGKIDEYFSALVKGLFREEAGVGAIMKCWIIFTCLLVLGRR